MAIVFKTIEPRDYSLAYSFLRDAFAISFGADPSQWPNRLGEMSEQSYVGIIERKLKKLPDSVIHVWMDDKIIGQIELSLKQDDPRCGYINLYYLSADQRGLGFGEQLDSFAVDKLKALGCEKAQLTVEHSNALALAFYKKQGWLEKGIHPEYGGLVMEKIF